MKNRTVDIVIVRMDKIGDLVLSLPIDRHPLFGGARTYWFISAGLGFIAEQSSPKRTFSEFKRAFRVGEFLRMKRWLKRNNPRTIILLHNPWWVSFAAWLAGVPERIGRQSQWHSYLFLNLPIRQKRSTADRHESDFNFDLIEIAAHRLGIRQSEDLARLKKEYLHLVAPNPQATMQTLNLKPREYRVVHPGMAGSALNWPGDNFYSLIEKLAGEMPVVITGTKMDAKYLKNLLPLKEKPGVHWLVDRLKTSQLLDLLSQAKSVVAPSTGVLHLAASLGTPVLGIYSPRKVEHPRRWGPKGARTAYLLPATTESAVIKPEVMREITPDQVFMQLKELER